MGQAWLADSRRRHPGARPKTADPADPGPLSQVKRYDYGDTALTRFQLRTRKEHHRHEDCRLSRHIRSRSRMDIVILSRRGFRMFEKVIVAIAPNPSKHPFFNVKNDWRW